MSSGTDIDVCPVCLCAIKPFIRYGEFGEEFDHAPDIVATGSTDWRRRVAHRSCFVGAARHYWIQWCRALVEAMKMREDLRTLRNSLDA